MKRTLIALVLAGLASVVPVASASPVCEPNSGQSIEPVPLPDDERIETLELEGWKVNVLVPPGYYAAGNDQRYPVLYVLHGASWSEEKGPNLYLAFTSLIELTASGPGVLVVMPFGGTQGWYNDWPAGPDAWESFHIRRLVPFIDQTYRTIPDRSHRATLGESMGGYGAMYYAARYPDMFGAAGSALGAVDIRPTPGFAEAIEAVLAGFNVVCNDGAPAGPWGSTEIDAANHNPTDLVVNLGGTTVYLGAGNGVPCTPADVSRFTAVYTTLEPLIRVLTEKMHRALVAEEVPHTIDLRSCGTHDWPYIDQDLRNFWPLMLDAFGSPPPSEFDYRRADPTFSVWDWTFTADPARAPEFLDVAGASCAGLALSGSGLTTVTTGRCFTPGASVLADDVEHVADAEGRLTLTVDLGPAHEHQQYTPAARALEAADANYWTTRSVDLGEL